MEPLTNTHARSNAVWGMRIRALQSENVIKMGSGQALRQGVNEKFAANSSVQSTDKVSAKVIGMAIGVFTNARRVTPQQVRSLKNVSTKSHGVVRS